MEADGTPDYPASPPAGRAVGRKGFETVTRWRTSFGWPGTGELQGKSLV